MDVIKVSASSRTSAVAGAIAGVIRENKHAEVQAIGAGGAVNQAMKALVLAIGYLKEDGIMNDPQTAQLVNQDYQDGVKAEVRGTPAIYVNGALLKNTNPEGFQAAIDKELRRKERSDWAQENEVVGKRPAAVTPALRLRSG